VTTTERAAAIRAAYKAKGWSSRDISVRSEYYSMGSSIHVNIKNPAVPLTVAKPIATAHERIDRCTVSDEILSGCNRYVSVNYTHEAAAAIAARYAPVLDAAAAELAAADSNVLIPIGDTGFLMGKGHCGWGVSLWNDGHIVTGTTPADLAVPMHARLVTA
jgi:hypothetical protein